MATPPLLIYSSPDAITQASGFMSQWNDKSANGYPAVQATANRKPLVSARLGAPCFTTGVQSGTARFAVATLPQQDINNLSLYLLLAPHATGVAGTRYYLAANAGAAMEYFEFPLGSGNLNPIMDFPVPAVQSTQGTFFSDTPALISFVGDGATRKTWFNGVLSMSGAVAGANNLFTTLTIGIDTAHASDILATQNDVISWAVFQGAHTTAQRLVAEALFANAYGAQAVFDGNSQVAGGNASGQGAAMPMRTASVFTTRFLMNVNGGTNGITTPQLTARFVATTLPLFNTNCARHILVVCEGENDIAANGASANPADTTYAATAWANLVAYAALARAQVAGVRIVCVTIPPNANGAAPANYEACRLATNALIRANYVGVFDALADAGNVATSAVGPLAAASAGIYYIADKQHWNDAGLLVVATQIANAIAVTGWV